MLVGILSFNKMSSGLLLAGLMTLLSVQILNFILEKRERKKVFY